MAKRLCDLADGGQVFVSRLVVDLIGAGRGLEFEPLGPLPVKGMAAPVEGWGVVWAEDPRVPLPARSPACGRASFVGQAPRLGRSRLGGGARRRGLAGCVRGW